MASAARPNLPFLVERPASLVRRLRQELRAAETATGLAGESGAPLALGIPRIDDALGGGLAVGAVHEIAAAREPETAAATGFVLALIAGLERQKCDDERPGRLVVRNRGTAAGRWVIWVAEDLSCAENGVPYGPGLDEAGIAPEQLITVAVARGRDVLWTMEEALRCRAVGAVIGELRSRVLDQVATRRLSLAAAAGNTLGLLLRTTPDDEPSAAATRWIIGAAASVPARGGERIGSPRLAARLVRNRRGHLGAWIVEWNSVEQRLELATHPEPLAGATFDRPHRAAIV